ncbi:MAG: 4Fe-4S dicluster domain-containing protein [Bdellovibrionaceae bacterium]|nr:4Fe-4S dicluster domain-containing protein [Bdellovibrionales bacterium]MCB9084019.1 4Fe-4S dicluster domain-containing protein [Pseudobdellovibrionaceae bacterium]
MSEVRRASLEDLDRLFQLLHRGRYQIIGPRLESQAIGYGELRSREDLPIGWTEEQSPGRYRLKKRTDQAHFGFTVGPGGFRRFLQKPRESLFQANKKNNKWKVHPTESPAQKLAFLGVRGCEWKAIQIQDQVFVEGTYQDQHYQSRRSQLLVIGVDCVTSATTCFCTSFDSGPSVGEGTDLRLTEIVGDAHHYFLVRAGGKAGSRLLEKWNLDLATDKDIKQGEELVTANRQRIESHSQIATKGLKEGLVKEWNHPQWEVLGQKCLACANCTLVCPTCFCSNSVEEVSLEGDRVERFRQWDSCFTGDHAYLHGGGVRPDVKSRYRQWLTHKLSSWQDQFGEVGCTGCGRCIVWCPVGIDLREEVQILRQNSEEEK